MVTDKDKTKNLTLARQNCANWNSGDCLGCMMKTKNKVLIFKVSSKFAGKVCQVNTKCDYFDNIVLPGVTNGI